MLKKLYAKGRSKDAKKSEQEKNVRVQVFIRIFRVILLEYKEKDSLAVYRIRSYSRIVPHYLNEKLLVRMRLIR